MRARVTQRVVLDEEWLDHFRRHGVFRKIEEDVGVECDYKSEHRSRALSPYERPVVLLPLTLKAISGELRDVRRGLKQLVSSIQDYAERKSAPDNIKLLIPQQYVAKIIGVGGNMIKEISSLSGGAHVKIMTDKEKERSIGETVAVIIGKVEAKAEAAGLILERITAFRYTMKVLQ